MQSRRSRRRTLMFMDIARNRRRSPLTPVWQVIQSVCPKGPLGNVCADETRAQARADFCPAPGFRNPDRGSDPVPGRKSDCHRKPATWHRSVADSEQRLSAVRRHDQPGQGLRFRDKREQGWLAGDLCQRQSSAVVQHRFLPRGMVRRPRWSIDVDYCIHRGRPPACMPNRRQFDKPEGLQLALELHVDRADELD